MMIRVNGEFLDFNDDIEIEEQIKLFQDVETANGDYSYSFELSKTNKNLKALGLPFPDTVKRIYRDVPCDIFDDSGFLQRTGALRVTNVLSVISATFFGGNNDWFSLLSEPLASMPLQKYDINLTTANIQASWAKDNGLVFPLIDTGTLITRSFGSTVVSDFTGMFYAKTLFKEIFNAQGIKLNGDLFKDSTFNALVMAANGRSDADVKTRSCYVKKTTAQNGISSLTKVTFQDESTFPFFDGSQGNFANSTYTADVKMLLKTEVNLTINPTVTTTGRVRIRVNGSNYKSYSWGDTSGNVVFFNKTLNIPLNAGDTVEVYVDFTSGLTFNVTAGTFRATPVFIYRVFGKSSVPNWTQGEFVSNIIRIFNVLPSYNPTSKTLTLDLFNKITQKEPIDISQSVNDFEIDFSDFVSGYAQTNIFSYQEGSDEDLQQYNISNFISYGSGAIEIDNDFIKEQDDTVESDFTSPITYLNGAFDASLERINFIEIEEIDSKNITSVTESSGVIRFNITDADELFTDGDLVRIQTGVDGYNGDWVINAVTSTFISVIGGAFDADTTGTATLIRHKFTTDNNVYLFINVENILNLFFSSNVSFTVDDVPMTTTSLAYFNLLANGREINAKYKQSLSFGSVNNPLSYQKTLLDTYWPIFSRVLNDPVMLKGNAYFTRVKYEQLKTFLRPLRVRTNQTNNLYYLNRIRGYKNSSRPCYVELIKL